MPRMSASIHVVFCLIFLTILYSILYNGLRMVARASWRSEALKDCALATFLHSPTARARSPTKTQPCVPLISTMHGQPFLIPLSTMV